MNLEDIRKVIEKVSNSVITILTRDIGFDELFGPKVSEGLGSGFSIGKGLFVTSYHVIGNASEVRIVSKEGYVTKGEVIAINPFNDLALIYGDELDLPGLNISTEYHLGDVVLAIGNPLGLESVTMGIISGVDRTITSPAGNTLYVLQTDAAVNPGNSGGPLVNLKGEVVGVVTAMIPYAQGIGFAVPSKLVSSFLTNVNKFKRYVRPYIGVAVAKLNKAIASYLGLKTDRGVIVVNVDPSGPAYNEGIRRGDVIVSVNGDDVESPLDLIAKLEEVGAPSTVKLKIVRGRDTRVFEVETVPLF
ncbi:MAG: trypsin-like peptidase domain-containing protein [Sulfolobaceae archaeon]|nr:trypsin-like peptidase domain-containing protein [Sulfolobaceae archaeon]